MLPQDVQALINIYTRAKAQLINTITGKAARGNVTWYQRTLLKQVNEQLAELNRQAKEWVDKTIPENYQAGIDEANAGLKKAGINISVPETFAGLHTAAVDIIAKNTFADLVAANIFVGRQVSDSIRRAGIDAVAQKLSQGQTVKQCKQNLLSQLVDKGLNGIKDKRGRMISLESYASTVARSTTREATNRATLNQLTYLGYDLVKMSSHATSCKICAPLQGRVYSISGNDKRYPPLKFAHKGDHANIHPNCRHVLVPYIEALAKDVEEDRQFSNRSFDIDPRSQAEIDRYNQGQALKRKLRNDKNQFEDIKIGLPEDAPKSFSGYQSMKRANSERYQELKEKMKALNN